jgi:Ca2+-binding RTX toxin-like protein
LPYKSSGFEQLADELDFALSTRFLAMDMSAFDGSDGLNAAEGRLGRSQWPKAMAIAKEPLDGGVIAFDGGVGDDLIFGQGGNDTISGGGDDDTIEGGAGDDVLSGDGGEAATVLPVVPAGNLITNGDFTDDFDGWTVNNVTGAAPAATGTGNEAAFNTQDEDTYGDSISQTFDANIGQTQTVSLDLIENDGGNGDHTF